MTGPGAPSSDPWSWLLGRTATGGWRHAPFKALDPGQGQDPSHEPRVEVIRRLIAYPPRAFASLVEAVRNSDSDPRHPIQWCCHRSSGEAPARPYWMSFMKQKDPKGRRFYVAIELFDREALGLWFLSGYQDGGVPRDARAPFPEQPRVTLPRFEVRDSSIDKGAYDVWVRLAFMDALRTFDAARMEAETLPPPNISSIVDQSQILDLIKSHEKSHEKSGHSAGSAATRDQHLIETSDEEPANMRTARARLVVCPPGKSPILVPLARLVTVIGRDPRCDLVLDDRSISGEHARIVYREGVPTIEDLGSKNGTRVGTAPVRKGASPYALGAEAYIGLGNVGCYFVRDADETQPPGNPVPLRHRGRMEELVALGALPREAVDRAVSLAGAQGLTPAEILLADQVISPETWSGVPKVVAKSSGCFGSILFVLALVLVLVLGLSGCSSFAIPPFYEQEIDENVPMREGTREVTWEQDLGLHPIFEFRHSEKEDRTEVEWLFPLGQYEKKGEDKRVRFYPFYLRDVRTDPDGFKHDTTVCFPPGLFAGSNPLHGDFVYLFPFGGTMYGLFGKDEIVGVLFPLYAWTKDRGVETNHVLFPLIAWWSGGDEKATQEGFRVLPFYGHQKKVSAEGVTIFERTTVLWPFITWVTEGKNSRHPAESVFIFPFWGKTRSDSRDEDTVLWPFFRYYHDKTTHYEEWRAPFPVFFYGQDDGTPGVAAHTRFDVWPFFGVRTRGDSYFRQFIAWPIERYERQETDDYTDQRFWLLPFVYTMSRVSKKNPNYPDAPEWSSRKTRIWPLVRYERKKDGDIEVHALSPLWFDDPMLNFDTILDPLYRIFRYVDRTDGSRELDILLGIYASRRKADGSESWNVLGGLFGHRTSARGEGSVRLFWFLDVEMIGFVDRTGLAVIERFAFFRDIAVLTYGAVKSPFIVRMRGARIVWEILLAQVRFTGAQGAFLAAFAAMAIGTLILIEAVTFIPNASVVPHIVALITVKDVVPLLTALVIIGRSGTAISVELANMKLNREIDALVAMGLPLEHVIVLPRLLGAILSFIGMVIVGQAAGLVGGYLIAGQVVHMPFTLPVLIQNVHFEDMAVAFLKAVLLGGAIAVICIREGLSVTVSAREVPQAATRAVVRSMTFCLVLNSFLSIYT